MISHQTVVHDDYDFPHVHQGQWTPAYQIQHFYSSAYKKPVS